MTTRLESSSDGWEQVETDIFGLHNQDGCMTAKHFADRDETCLHPND